MAGGYQFLRNAEPRFWGVGPNTSPENQTDYLWDQQNVAITASTAARFFSLNAQAAWEDNRIGRGTDSSSRDLQNVAPPGALFGLSERTRYLRLNLGTTLDFTRQHRFHRQGAVLQLGSALFLGLDDTDSDFHAFDITLRGYVPINQRQSLVGQILTAITRADSGRGVPFYHLAGFGSSRGARSLDTDRFRDNDMAALMLEWRYEVWRELHESARAESFFFFDTGSVADRIDKLRFDELKYSWGFGFRLIALPDFFGSTFIALGTEGPRFRVVFTTIF